MKVIKALTLKRKRFTGDKDKYFNAVLYLSSKCDPSTVGKVKLAKLLYYLDFDHYEKHYQSVTKSKYYHLDLGPVPGQFQEWLEEMKNEGIINIEPHDIGLPNPMEVIIPLRSPKMEYFSDDEIETLNQVVNRWHDASGKFMSECAHSETPYDITNKNEEIPYQLALHRE